MAGQFRFVITTDRHDETLAFYRERLAFPVGDSWDHSPTERGALPEAGSGVAFTDLNRMVVGFFTPIAEAEPG